jgi:hypothetical protein
MLHSVVSRVAILGALGLVMSCAMSCSAGPPGGGDLAGTKPGDGGGGFCSPGATTSCICLGGSTGLQTCRATGQSYGPCINCGDGGTTTMGDMAISTGSTCGTCSGCCDGTTCVLAPDTTSCGAHGSACTSCDASTQICSSNGTCVSNATQSCTGCQFGTVCNNGACSMTIDPNAMFQMYVKEIHLTPTEGGEEWDDDGSAPDPFICISFTYNGVQSNGCNKYTDCEYDATPAAGDNLVGNSSGDSDATSALYIPGSVIINGGLTINVYDYDPIVSNDQAGQLTFPATSTYVKPFMTGAFDYTINVSFELD